MEAEPEPQWKGKLSDTSLSMPLSEAAELDRARNKQNKGETDGNDDEDEGDDDGSDGGKGNPDQTLHARQQSVNGLSSGAKPEPKPDPFGFADVSLSEREE